MKRCIACPFNDGFTKEATDAQNYACLPTAGEMRELSDAHGVSLSCHENDKKACRGLIAERLGALDQPVYAYSDWYKGVPYGSANGPR